jgi:hypothetical protein
MYKGNIWQVFMYISNQKILQLCYFILFEFWISFCHPIHFKNYNVNIDQGYNCKIECETDVFTIIPKGIHMKFCYLIKILHMQYHA